jgi:hypothetical protein
VHILQTQEEVDVVEWKWQSRQVCWRGGGGTGRVSRLTRINSSEKRKDAVYISVSSSNMSKRKLPAAAELTKIACTDNDDDDTTLTITEQPQQEQVHPALQLAQEQAAHGSPPRTIPKGSPAESFILQASPQKSDDNILTCNLSLIPKDRWNKRRQLSAIVIAVLPIQSKSSTVRRNVVLRDEKDECTVTVWGNHTNLLNESSIGRPVTLQRVCLTEFEGQIQIAMPKDASVSLGSTSVTVPMMHWLQRVGTSPISVLQVRPSYRTQHSPAPNTHTI